MTPHELRHDLELARRAVRAAGELVLQHFGGGDEVHYKHDDQPVTAADLRADRMLRQTLLGERPGYGWLSEETADSDERLRRERVWIVDPIDGTSSFVRERPEFMVSVGLAVDGTCVLGLVYNPATAELYHAVRGQGAFCGDRAIRVSDAGSGGRNKPLLWVSATELKAGALDALRDRWQLRQLGSTTYKMAKVADGTGDGYVALRTKWEWDVCAAALVVEEAGGRVTDLAGAAPRYNRRDPRVRGLVASNGALHEPLRTHAQSARERSTWISESP